MTDPQKTLDGLVELGRVVATAQESLRVAERMAADLPGDWAHTMREMADYAENTGYALDQQCLRIQEGQS